MLQKLIVALHSAVLASKYYWSREKSMFYKAQKRTNYWSKIRKKAPKVPDITCPAIDDILNQLEKQIGKELKQSKFKSIEKKMEKKHLNKISALLKKSKIKNIKPDSFKRYGSARKLYNFNIDNVSSY